MKWEVNIGEICRSYIDDFSGEGTPLFGGRWNKIDDPVNYLSSHLSLSLLEIIINVDYEKLPLNYSFPEVEILDASIRKLSLGFYKAKMGYRKCYNSTEIIWIELVKKSTKFSVIIAFCNLIKRE